MSDIQNGSLLRIKETELNILKAFIGICEKHSLRYFMLEGSCLGAVRHKGFIPWDDDVDVGMPRPDFEKFIKTAKKELPEKYFLQHAGTNPDFPMNFAKIRDSETAFIETSVKNLNINHGIYIDIFPIDGYKSSLLFDLKNKFYTLCVRKVFFAPNPRNGIKALCVKAVSGLIRDYKKARDKRDALLKKHSYVECATAANLCGPWEKREIVPKEWFGDGVPGTFEGLGVILPKEYDKYLRNLYGDYEKLPPEAERHSHHYCEIIDTEKSYSEYFGKI